MLYDTLWLELDAGGLVDGSSVGDDGTVDTISLPMLSTWRMCERLGSGSRSMVRRRLRPVLERAGQTGSQRRGKFGSEHR